MNNTILEPLQWEVSNHIGYLSMASPPGNVMDGFFFQELSRLTDEVIPYSGIKALIISGSARHFSSGAAVDQLLKEIVEGQDAADERARPSAGLRRNMASYRFLSELKIPVIAVIQGVCLGSALELALSCHFRLCSKDALFGLPESNYGLMPGLGGLQRLLAITGKAIAIELGIKGHTFSAQTALNYQIVDMILPKKFLMSAAVLLAETASERYRKYNKTDYLAAVHASLELG